VTTTKRKKDMIKVKGNQSGDPDEMEDGMMMQVILE
jgi:hypothetical protein